VVPSKILVATDGSKPAQAAEAFAADMANEIGTCEIVLVHVVRPSSGPAAARGGVALWPLSPQELDIANQLLEDGVKRIRAALTVDGASVRPMLVAARSTAKGIVDFAQEEGTCSFIVMGHRGLGGFAGLVMGSVSTQVVQAAHCPVVVIKS